MLGNALGVVHGGSTKPWAVKFPLKIDEVRTVHLNIHLVTFISSLKPLICTFWNCHYLPPMDQQNSIEPRDEVHGRGNKPLEQPAHASSSSKVAEELGSDAQFGLSADEARTRSGKYGQNDLGDGGGVQPLKILLRQIANVCIRTK